MDKMNIFEHGSVKVVDSREVAEIMNGILGALMESKFWNRMEKENPRIIEAEEALSNQLDMLNLSRDQRDEIEAAITEKYCAYQDIDVLFGMHVMQTILQTAQDPTSYILEQIRGAQSRKKVE